MVFAEEYSIRKPTKSLISWRGNTFSSYAEFQASPIYQDLLAEGAKRKAARLFEEQQAIATHVQALKIGRKWYGKSMVDWDYHNRITRGKEIMGW